MPPLLLDDDEAIAIAVGLRTAARASVTGIEDAAVRALVKLEQVLPAKLRRRVAALGQATVAPPVGGPTVDLQASLCWRAAAGTPSGCASPTALATDRRLAARSSRTRSSTSAAAGTSPLGTRRATTGAPSASTASSARPRPASL